MEFTLLSVKCENQECRYEFVTNSREHTSCPSCGENIVYSDDYITAISNDIFSNDINSLMSNKEGVLAGVVIALAYINGEDTVARYDDCDGFRFNIKESIYTDKFLKILEIASRYHLEYLIEEYMNAHESFIIEPIFECIVRNYYYNEDCDLYESGNIESFISKKFYDWIIANISYVKKMLK